MKLIIIIIIIIVFFVVYNILSFGLIEALDSKGTLYTLIKGF